MNTPIRIQRRRTKGFNLLEYSRSINGLDVYYAGRPGKWGNMFKIGGGESLGGDVIYISSEGRRQTTDEWITLCVVKEGSGAKIVHDLYWHVITGDADAIQRMTGLSNKDMIDINYWINKMEENDLEELRGKNLACFCAAGFQYCHAEVLLYFANKPK